MGGQGLFRATTAAVLVLVFGIAARYRRRARAGEGRPDRADEPVFLRAARAVVAGPLFLGVLVYLVRPGWMAFGQVDLPVAVRWVGVGLMAVSVPASWWVHRHLGRNVTETTLVAAGSRLVTTGPYSRTRHPLYTCSLLLWSGVSLTAANVFLAAFTVLFGWMLVGLVVPREEAALLEEHGEAFERYRWETGRLLPRLRR